MDKLHVIKIGGNVIENQETFLDFLKDYAICVASLPPP